MSVNTPNPLPHFELLTLPNNKKPILNTHSTFEFVKKSPKVKVIHIGTIDHYYYGDQLINGYFLFKPAILSIIKCLKVRYKDVVIKYISLNQEDKEYFNNIKKQDILIWIGHRLKPNFHLLKKRGVYTIYYNPEPNTTIYASNEIWTYSKYLCKKYIKENPNKIIKFLPISFENNKNKLNYLLNNERKLIFLGSLDLRKEKKAKLLTDPNTKNDIIEVYNLWNDKDFNSFMNNKSHIFLNLTKDGTNALPSFRINKLLSHKSIIISEHTNKLDDKMYEDLLYFCDIDKIGKLYYELKNKTPVELQEIANQFYDRFKTKFSQI
jgi:hypothetical protein